MSVNVAPVARPQFKTATKYTRATGAEANKSILPKPILAAISQVNPFIFTSSKTATITSNPFPNFEVPLNVFGMCYKSIND